MPRFSVLLPTHNRADLLLYALRSCQFQSEPDFEVLIVGDGCTDNSAEVVASFNDPRFRWFDLPKAAGYGYANRNLALKEARGKYIAFLAHDNLWLRDHLARLGDCLDATGAEFVYSRPLWISRDGKIVPSAINLHHPAHLHTLLTERNSIPPTFAAYPTSNHDRYGMWDASLPASGDWDMWKRYLRNGNAPKIGYVPTPTAIHFTARHQPADYVARQGSVRGWLLMDQREGLPTALKVAMPDGRLEQEVIWQRLSSDADAFEGALREAVTQVIDYAAEQHLRALIEIPAPPSVRLYRAVQRVIKGVRKRGG